MVSEMKSLGVDIVKLHPNVPTPTYGTSMSACFDLSFYPTSDVTVYTTPTNHRYTMDIASILRDGHIRIYPGHRVLTPTGLIFSIPNCFDKSYSIRLHPRSGLALKHGITLANSQGIVDLDYQQEVFAIMQNTSDVPFILDIGTRICQAEIIQNIPVMFNIKDSVESKSERSGGFGSTGV